MHAQFAALITFLVISWLNWRQTRAVSCALIYDDAIRACAVSTVTADRTGKFVLLTYSLTASHCSTEAHLTRAWCWSKAEVRVWKVSLDVDAKKHRFRVLIKAVIVKKKGTKTEVLSRVAKGVTSLDQWWPILELSEQGPRRSLGHTGPHRWRKKKNA